MPIEVPTQEDFATLQAVISTHGAQIANLQASVGDNNAQIAQNTGTITRIDAELNDVYGRIEGNSNLIALLQEKANRVEAEVELNRTLLADLENSVSALVLRVRELEGNGGGNPIPRTENELEILAEVADLLALDTPGPDVVDVDGVKWFGVADVQTNPQYIGVPHVRTTIEAADRAWRNAGSPEDGGIAIMPGVHFTSNLGRENFFRHVKRVRAQDKTQETILDAARGWPRSDFAIFHAADFILTLEGFEVRNAAGRSRRANIGATSDANSRLVLIEMTMRNGDNGVRTTGRDVAMFRCLMEGNSLTDVAHGAYLSNDNRRGRHTRAVVAVDCVSINNARAHGIKTRAKYFYVKGGLYETQNGFAIDNAQGGRMLVEDVTLVQKAPSPQWVVIAHGLDKLERDTGFARGDDFKRQHQVTNVWRGTSTLRNVHVRNARNPRSIGAWNNSKYRLPVVDPVTGKFQRDTQGNFVYDPTSEVFVANPMELINVTADDRQIADASAVVGPAVVLG